MMQKAKDADKVNYENELQLRFVHISNLTVRCAHMCVCTCMRVYGVYVCLHTSCVPCV